MKKVCFRCGGSSEPFNHNSCAACVAAYYHRYYAENAETLRAKRRARYARDRETTRLQRKRWRIFPRTPQK